MSLVLKVFECPNDRPGADRPAPNTGLSFFQSEGSSYSYRWFRPSLGGRTIEEVSAWFKERRGRTVAENEIWIMCDYNNFHAEGGSSAVRRYLYADGHVADYEN